MKTILVTGYAGFIGKHLTRLLDEYKLPWVGYDLRDNRDIRNKYELDSFFENNQVRQVIHLAARPGVRKSKSYPEEFISTNILGTQNIVEMCNKHKVDRLIFYSSSSIFGNGSTPPFKESDNKLPTALYGISKLTGEHIVNNAECQTVIIRPFTVYGEDGRRDEIVYRWLNQYKNRVPITIYGDGSSCREYVYVNDLVAATVSLLNIKLESYHEDFNLGGSEIVSLETVVNIFKEMLPDAIFVRMEMPKEETYVSSADISKANKFMGFDPQPNFEKNLREIIMKEINL